MTEHNPESPQMAISHTPEQIIQMIELTCTASLLLTPWNISSTLSSASSVGHWSKVCCSTLDKRCSRDLIVERNWKNFSSNLHSGSKLSRSCVCTCIGVYAANIAVCIMCIALRRRRNSNTALHQNTLFLSRSIFRWVGPGIEDPDLAGTA